MSDSYIDGKVREALIESGGSRASAQRTLMLWAMKDERLLRGMVAPFLKAISGAAIEAAFKRGLTLPGGIAVAGMRAGGGSSGGGRPGPGGMRATTGTLSKEDLARVLDRIGKGGDSEPAPAPAGRPAAGASSRPGGSGQAGAIQTLAAIYARNRKQR